VSDPASYYALLQLDPAAEPEVIEAAYRRLARKYHPDVDGSPGAGPRMQEINRAYATLSRPHRRAIYDRELRRATQVKASLGRPAAGPRTPRTSTGDRPVYAAGTEPLATRAAAAASRWAAEWAESLEAVLVGDPGGRPRASEASRRCLTELSACLARWEALVPPPAAGRLGELGSACLRLESALVRGTLSLAEADDYSVLQPLAGLAERIGGLSRTIAAEASVLSRDANLGRGR